MTESEKEIYKNNITKYLIVYTKDCSLYLYNIDELEKISIGAIEIANDSFEKIKIIRDIEL